MAKDGACLFRAVGTCNNTIYIIYYIIIRALVHSCIPHKFIAVVSKMVSIKLFK